MYSDQRILGVISARGGSKGIPGKNVRPVAGKPLIAWTIEAGQGSRFLDRMILTTDDEAIAAAARTFGCEVPFRRPAELAEDHTPGVAPVLHALDAIDASFDYVVLLQPTSPLRTADDIDKGVALTIDNQLPLTIGVTAPPVSPNCLYRRSRDGFLRSRFLGDGSTQRQDFEDFVAVNGAFYMARCDWLRVNGSFSSSEAFGYAMPRDRSLDIDDHFDLQLADYLLQRRFSDEPASNTTP